MLEEFFIQVHTTFFTLKFIEHMYWFVYKKKLSLTIKKRRSEIFVIKQITNSEIKNKVKIDFPFNF